MSDRTEQLRQAYRSLNDGDVTGFKTLFTKDAQWIGIPGRGWEGATPT